MLEEHLIINGHNYVLLWDISSNLKAYLLKHRMASILYGTVYKDYINIHSYPWHSAGLRIEMNKRLELVQVSLHGEACPAPCATKR